MATRIAGAHDHEELLLGDFPPPQRLVDRLVVEGGSAVWSARWGTGKTWLGLELARSIASGTSFLCHFPTRQGKVLYLDQEGTPSGHKERLVKLNNGRPLPTDLDIRFIYLSGMHLTDVEGFMTLDRMLTEEKPALVILDSWVRFFRGNENDPVAVASLNDSLRSLRLAHGCATLPLDHDRKPPPGGSDQPEHRTRGSVEKLAGVDNGLAIEKAKDESGVLLAHPIKSRWDADLPPFRIAFAADPDHNAVTLKWLGEASREQVEKQFGKPVLVAQAIVALKDQWGEDAATTTTIAGYLEWPETTTRRVIGDMLKAGQVTPRSGRSSGGRKATFFDLAEAE